MTGRDGTGRDGTDARRHVGDAREFLRRLEARSVQLCITDPPWELKRNGGGAGKFEECATYKRMSPAKIARIFGAARSRFVPGAHLYTWAPAGSELGEIIPAFERNGWRLIRVLAWDRVVHRGLGAYRNAWEPVLIFSNGTRPRPFRMSGKYSSLLSFRGPEYRTAKPWQAYRVFLEMSSAPGDLVIDPFCGLNPLEAAAASLGDRKWQSCDVVDAAEIRREVATRTRHRHSGHPSRHARVATQKVLL